MAHPHLSFDKNLLAQTGDLNGGDWDRGVILAQRVAAQRDSRLRRRLHGKTQQVQKRMTCEERGRLLFLQPILLALLILLSTLLKYFRLDYFHVVVEHL